MKHSLFVLLMLCFSLLVADSAPAAEVSVTDAWIREAPPGAQMLAAYMTIGNNSTHGVQLEAVSSPDFRRIEIHQTKTHEGMSQMLKQSHLQIKAGDKVVLEPGSWHLMLMQPVRSFRAGDAVKLQLRFDNGDLVEATAILQRR